MGSPVAITDTGWTFRALPDALARWGVEPSGVVHIGAHRGEEVPAYRECGFGSIVLVEPDPANAAACAALDGVTVIEAAVDSERGRAMLCSPKDTRYAGLVPHHARPPVTRFEVATVPAADVQCDANVMVVDTQGTELDVLASADLDRLDLVIVETSHAPEPVYAAPYDRLVAWMAERGWRVAETWAHEAAYGDTLFVPAVRRG